MDKIANDVREIVAGAEMQQRLIGQGATPVGSSPAQFQAMIESESQRYKKIIVEKSITATD